MDRVFTGCSLLHKISIPSSVISTGKNIFSDIKSVELIENIDYIQDYLFYFFNLY